MTANEHETTFELTQIIAEDERPVHRRLSCRIKGGGQLAIWGKDGNTANVDKIKAAFPCFISTADWRPAKAWEREKYGDTHVLEEHHHVHIL